MQTPSETYTSQFGQSPAITALMDSFNAAEDPQNILGDFYNKVWNIATAQGWGLDVWGRIVGVSRVLKITPTKYLGFQQALPGITTFGHGAWYIGQAPLTQNYYLTDEAYRQLILVKAAANICIGSVTAINQLLLRIFPGRGNCYVIDNADHTFVYFFSFALSPVEVAIVTNSGVLPRPSGMAVSYVIQPMMVGSDRLAAHDTFTAH
jgi:Protein of unknown function (DUF2612)